jgi:hypothetical protein
MSGEAAALFVFLKPGAWTPEPRKEKPMSQEVVSRSRPSSSGLGSLLWFAGWLFTIAFAKLVWWKAVLGLVIWPYFLALAVR